MLDVTLKPVTGGYRVKETELHYIEVHRMLYNWRLVRIPKSCPLTIDRGWCYFGTDELALTVAVLAATQWDGADDTEPVGWNKNVQTGEIRRD